MRQFAFASVLTLALSGCAEFERFTAALSSPQTTHAFANLRAGATAMVCALSSAAALAGRVEQAVDAGQAVVGTTGKVYVASSIVCASLGGVVTGAAVVK